jgi:hypothetical protein
VTRLEDLKRFYALLDELEGHLNGKRTLADCNGRMHWPSRGVYFFFEPGEARSDSGNGMRVVRVGTHLYISYAYEPAKDRIIIRRSGHARMWRLNLTHCSNL